MRVAFIVVSYNSTQVIRGCLTSLLNQTTPAAEIIVVDNASTDGCIDLIKREFPTVHLIENARNVGFAAANNQAMQQSQADLYVLVNHDAELDSDWLAEVVACFERYPDAGIVGCKIFYSNRVLLQHTGGTIGPNALTDHRGANEFDIGQYDSVQAVDYVMGAAFAIRRTVAEQHRYLSEAYFMYYEETDLCVRVRQAGYQVLYCPSAVAVHHEKHSFSLQLSSKFFRRYHTSRLKFVGRTYSPQKFWYEFVPAERKWLRYHLHGKKNRLIVFSAYLRTFRYWFPLFRQRS